MLNGGCKFDSNKLLIRFNYNSNNDDYDEQEAVDDVDKYKWRWNKPNYNKSVTYINDAVDDDNDACAQYII